MIRLRSTCALLLLSAALAASSSAQNSSPSPAHSNATDLLSLSRKIDEQNMKIDLLSQQILRLQQMIEHSKSSGPMTSSTSQVEGTTHTPAATGSTHVVERGETLTSIARMHKVGIDELQKFNHIEDDRHLQIGQTLVIPGAQTAAPSPSPSPSP